MSKKTPAQIAAALLGSLGGKARAKSTTHAQRVKWAKLGGRPKNPKDKARAALVAYHAGVDVAVIHPAPLSSGTDETATAGKP